MPYPFAPFNPWMIANPTLPKLYWEVKSPEQLVANLYCIIDALKDYTNDQSDQININTEDIEQLQDAIDAIENGAYFEKYVDGLAKWIDDNLINYVARMAYYVFPMLWENTDGAWHYAMKVPNTWKQLKFEWIWNDTDNTWYIGLAY